MENKTFVINYEASDDAIHKFAATLLLSRYDAECILNQGDFAYRVNGGTDGCLYYKEGQNWFLKPNYWRSGLHTSLRRQKMLDRKVVKN